MHVLLALLGCRNTLVVAPDLTERLGAGEVRAGVVTDEAALFGGGAASGEKGDIKLYNDRVQFVVQGMRLGDGYLDMGGTLLDADIVRAEGEPNHDMLTGMAFMAGIGRIVMPTDVRVVSDGSDGAAAVVRVEGRFEALSFIEGVVPGIVSPKQGTAVTEYTLRPDTLLLEVESTVTWEDSATSVSPGDLTMMSKGLGETYQPEAGFGSDAPDEFGWTAYVGAHNEAAVAFLADGEPFGRTAASDLLAYIKAGVIGFDRSTELERGDTLTWRRMVGVGADLASVTAAWWDMRGEEQSELTGRVTAGGSPVAGARAHLLDELGNPVTLAVTGADGFWRARVPQGAVASVRVTGRGQGHDITKPVGTPWYSPYTTAAIREATIASYAMGAGSPPMAEGMGVSPVVPIGDAAEIELTPPARLTIEVADGRPATARLDFAKGDPSPGDTRLHPERPSGASAWGTLMNGRGTLQVEPGDYVLAVMRGADHEIDVRSITLSAGEEISVEASVPRVVSLPGVVVLDTHVHASPSPDGGVDMADRLLIQAAHGIEVHVGTDHDHVVDYRPLLAPLGLDGVLKSVVADEVSPFLPGHFNAFPLVSVPEEENHGAWLWWKAPLSATELFTRIRAMGDGGPAFIQSNHPTSGGILAGSGYQEGTIDAPEQWDPTFDLIEVVNGGGFGDFFGQYLDLTARGLLPAASGSSDSHQLRDGNTGISRTLLFTGGSFEDFDVASLRAALERRATVASNGPSLFVTAGGEWAPGSTHDGPVTLDVEVWSPSWMPVDTVEVYENGVLVTSLPVTGPAPMRASLSVPLAPASDAVYVVAVRSSQAVTQGYPGMVPFAATTAIRVDAHGSGWDAPLPGFW